MVVIVVDANVVEVVDDVDAVATVVVERWMVVEVVGVDFLKKFTYF